MPKLISLKKKLDSIYCIRSRLIKGVWGNEVGLTTLGTRDYAWTKENDILLKN